MSRLAARRDALKKPKCLTVVGHQFVDHVRAGGVLGHVSLLRRFRT
jgi:hypothetical protein